MIELLDVNKTWSKIAAGFKNGPFFKRPAPKQSFRYTSAVEPITRQAQDTAEQTPKSAFTGKTFNQRKG